MIMKKQYFNKIILLYVLFCSFWASNTRAGEILEQYVQDHAFTSSTAEPLFNIRPHEFSSPEFMRAYEAINNSIELKNDVEQILNGGELIPETNPMIWDFLRGGDIIGNGGGIVETKFAYHYNNIPSYIQDCLSSYSACPVEREDRLALEKIKETFIDKKDDKNRMIFLSGQEHPDFFSGGSLWGARSAKTGFDRTVPIFINTDHLYQADQKPAMDDSEIIALLIHETGHQNEVRDHIYLDRIGVTIANYIKTRAHIVSRDYLNENHTLQIFNYRDANLKADASFYYRDQQIDLKPMLWSALSCWHPDQKVVGYELTNPHWLRGYDEGSREVFPVGVWATIYCQNPRGRSVFKKDMDLQFDFIFGLDENRKLLETKVKIIKTH